MKTQLQLWGKIVIGMLILVVVFYTGFSVKKTGAWFVDTGTLVVANYGIGVIDYTVFINGSDIEKIKGGQKVQVAVPITGAAKINDIDLPVSNADGTTHDEFDEGVTLVRTKIINKGGLPIGIKVQVDSQNLTSAGIVSMVVPYGEVVDNENCQIRTSGAAVASGKNYKGYIKEKLNKQGSNWNTYDALVADMKGYLETVNALTKTKNKVVAYPGKLPSVKPDALGTVSSSAIGLEVNTLCWAEYDEMLYSPAKGGNPTDNSNTWKMTEGKGQLIFTITCTL